MKIPIAPTITENVLVGLEVMARCGLLVEYLEGIIDKDYVKDLPDFKHLSNVQAAQKFIERRRKYARDKAEYNRLLEKEQ